MAINLDGKTGHVTGVVGNSQLVASQPSEVGGCSKMRLSFLICGMSLKRNDYSALEYELSGFKASVPFDVSEDFVMT